MFILRLAAGVLPAVLLASCASLSGRPSPPVPEPDLAWAVREPQLQELRTWEFSGRISVTGPEGAWNARIRWTQRGDAYEVYFMTPFGQGMARLEGGNSGVMLQMTDQEPVRAATAGELLATTFGWSAPLEALRYWIVGMPQPQHDAEILLDDHGRLLRLEQDGWRVDYPQYAATTGPVRDMPRRLALEGDPLRIRLVIDRWEIRE